MREKKGVCIQWKRCPCSLILQAKSDMLGFVWTGPNEVVYITAKGIEQHQVRVSGKYT